MPKHELLSTPGRPVPGCPACADLSSQRQLALERLTAQVKLRHENNGRIFMGGYTEPARVSHAFEQKRIAEWEVVEKKRIEVAYHFVCPTTLSAAAPAAAARRGIPAGFPQSESEMKNVRANFIKLRRRSRETELQALEEAMARHERKWGATGRTPLPAAPPSAPPRRTASARSAGVAAPPPAAVENFLVNLKREQAAARQEVHALADILNDVAHAAAAAEAAHAAALQRARTWWDTTWAAYETDAAKYDAMAVL